MYLKSFTVPKYHFNYTHFFTRGNIPYNICDFSIMLLFYETFHKLIYQKKLQKLKNQGICHFSNVSSNTVNRLERSSLLRIRTKRTAQDLISLAPSTGRFQAAWLPIDTSPLASWLQRSVRSCESV
ncbi:unnamed protein product [Oikopleura dioica]|uniref:Uncharacterized protein n=1 Tax=Oikopleura dioica TaxID=34765 RepID=E4Y7D1_OIKDI|nr:unnamed protein product [Oikopleura dioica]